MQLSLALMQKQLVSLHVPKFLLKKQNLKTNINVFQFTKKENLLIILSYF
jgi:hypothetical protein